MLEFLPGVTSIYCTESWMRKISRVTCLSLSIFSVIDLTLDVMNKYKKTLSIEHISNLSKIHATCDVLTTTELYANVVVAILLIFFSEFFCGVPDPHEKAKN